MKPSLLIALPLVLALASCQKPADVTSEADVSGAPVAAAPVAATPSPASQPSADMKTDAAAKPAPKVEVKPEPAIEVVSEPAVEPEPAAKTEPTGAPVKASHVDAKGAKALLDSDAAVIVIDVRTPGEFADGHVEGGVLMNLFDKSFKTKVAALDRSKTYLVHCKVGGRSTRALGIFEELGFQHVVHMDGGFDDWKAASLPVAK